MDALRAVPNTPAAHAASRVADEYLSGALLNHSMRSWLWAVGFAELDDVGDFDDELLYVAAALHDISLVEPFDSYGTDFEFAGGQIAGVPAAGASWSDDRRAHLAGAVIAHIAAAPVVAGGVEGRLLDVATSLDISGARADALPRGYVVSVLERYPRLDISTDFAGRVKSQAERKPGSAAARIVNAGVAKSLLSNPLEGLHPRDVGHGQ